MKPNLISRMLTLILVITLFSVPQLSALGTASLSPFEADMCGGYLEQITLQAHTIQNMGNTTLHNVTASLYVPANAGLSIVSSPLIPLGTLAPFETVPFNPQWVLQCANPQSGVCTAYVEYNSIDGNQGNSLAEASFTLIVHALDSAASIKQEREQPATLPTGSFIGIPEGWAISQIGLLVVLLLLAGLLLYYFFIGKNHPPEGFGSKISEIFHKHPKAPQKEKLVTNSPSASTATKPSVQEQPQQTLQKTDKATSTINAQTPTAQTPTHAEVSAIVEQARKELNIDKNSAEGLSKIADWYTHLPQEQKNVLYARFIVALLKEGPDAQIHKQPHIQIEPLQLADGSRIKNLNHLAITLENMHDVTFRRHVNEHRNDISEWVELSVGNRDLAHLLSQVKTKDDMRTLLVHYLISEHIGGE